MYIFGLMVQGVGYYILDCICFRLSAATMEKFEKQGLL